MEGWREGGRERGMIPSPFLMAPSTLTTAALISELNDPCFPKGWEALIKPGKMHIHFQLPTTSQCRQEAEGS